MISQETRDNIDELLAELNHEVIMHELSEETFKVWLRCWKQKFYRQLQILTEEANDDK